MRSSATSLKNAQSLLSIESAHLSVEQLEKINPGNIVMRFEKVEGMADSVSFGIWQALMEITVEVFRLAEKPQIIQDNAADMMLLQQNSLNPVLSGVIASTSAIMEMTEEERSSNIQTFFILLIAISSALLISMGMLLPAANKAKKCKQEVFELFAHRKIERSIDEQLRRCRIFQTNWQSRQENKEGEDHLDN